MQVPEGTCLNRKKRGLLGSTIFPLKTAMGGRVGGYRFLAGLGFDLGQHELTTLFT